MTLQEQLETQIVSAQEAYYEGSPIMSDAQYDALESQLRAINPNSNAFKTVGKSTSTEPRIKHSRPMLSIENYYTKESFAEAAKNYGTFVLIEPKFDGCSGELQYLDGILVRAVSRGDGNSGEDMTAQTITAKRRTRRAYV